MKQFEENSGVIRTDDFEQEEFLKFQPEFKEQVEEFQKNMKRQDTDLDDK